MSEQKDNIPQEVKDFECYNNMDGICFQTNQICTLCMKDKNNYY